MSYTVAIIGPKAVISGFRALGVIPFDAEDSQTALDILKKIKRDLNDPNASEKIATVIMIESIAHDIPSDELEKISRGALPALVLLPGLGGSHGVGVAKLKALAEKAIGSDILG